MLSTIDSKYRWQSGHDNPVYRQARIYPIRYGRTPIYARCLNQTRLLFPSQNPDVTIVSESLVRYDAQIPWSPHLAGARDQGDYNWMANGPVSFDLFISYASPDLKFAEALNRRLTNAGFSVWFDKARLNPGCDWHKEIESGCDSARVILPILTPRWKLSEWTRYETYGHDLVIPLVFEGNLLVRDAQGNIDENASISTPPLRHLQADTIDFRSFGAHDWLRLVTAIKSALATPIPEMAKRLTRMRYGHTEHFVGREGTLNELHEKLWTGPTAALTQGHVQSVTALGGVGKTALAREYADRFWRLYPQAFWVDCRLGVESEFAAVFDLLFPDLNNVGLEPNVKAKRAFDELNQSTTRSIRLLVLDNALDEQAVLSWIPRAGRCHTVITSRFKGWSNPTEVCNVWVLEAGPARRLLLSRAGRELDALSSDEHAAVDKLAELLGHLPLALEQAAAYIGAPGNSCSYREYIRRFEAAQKHFLSLQLSRGSTEYPLSVYATWRTTIDCLTEGPRAILRLAAFMATTPIPNSMWLAGASIVEAQMRRLGTLADDHPPFDIQIPEWIADLARYSMVQMLDGSGDPAFSVHGLVQAVERHSVDNDLYDKTVEDAADVIVEQNFATRNYLDELPRLRLLFPHAEAIWNCARGHPGADINPDLLDGLTKLTGCMDDVAKCRKFATAAYRIRRHRLGDDHQDTLISLHELAVACYISGQYERAESLFRKCTERKEEKYGFDHRETLASAQRLAETLRANGRAREAAQLMTRVVPAMEKATGYDAFETLTCMGTLAVCLQKLGKYDESIELFTEALRRFSLKPKPEHPEAAILRGNMAGSLWKAGRLAEAEQAYRKAVEDQEHIFGPDHTDTCVTRNNFARFLQEFKGLGAAEPLYRRTLELRMAAHKPDDAPFAIVLNTHALLLRMLKRHDEAAELLRRAIGIEDRLLSPNHPRRAHRRNNLAIVCMLADQLDEAVCINAEAWLLMAGQHDVTSCRILIVRIALYWLRNVDATLYLAQLRWLLAQPELPCLGGIDPKWDAVDVLDHLRAQLAPEKANLFVAITSFLNEPGTVADLEQFDLWKSTPAIPLVVPWPDELKRGTHPMLE